MNCDICTLPYTHKKRSPIQCAYCNHIACFSCVHTYNVQHMTEFPFCMFCNQQWTDDDMHKCVDESFYSKWIHNRKQYLFDVEMSKIPSSQKYYNYDKHIHTCEEYLSELLKKQLRFDGMESHEDEIRQLYCKIRNWRHGYIMGAMDKQKDNELVSKCPNVSCKGYVSDAHSCDICGKHVCTHCLQIQDANHECNENEKKSIQYMIKSAKPCPNCGIFIHKLEGCDQMWCVYCKHGFSWKTNRVNLNSEHIHNPHYFEWLLENTKNMDTPCRNDFIRSVSHKLGGEHESVSWMLLFYRLHGHIQYVTNRYYTILNENESTNLDVRLLWLKNELTENKMKTILHKRYKSKSMRQHIYQIFHVFIQISSRHLHEFMHDECKSCTTKTKFDSLIQTTNDAFRNLTHIYKTSMPFIEIICNHKNRPDFVTSNKLLSRIYFK